MTSTTIADVRCWEALDSRGRPTVGCAVTLTSGATGRVIAPSGASTGAHEAKELRDGGSRYGGYGVRRAVANVLDELRPAVLGHHATDQARIDAVIQQVDDSAAFARLGGNAVLSLSLAVHRAATVHGQLFGTRSGQQDADPVRETGHRQYLPMPMFNIVSGGAHAAGAIDVQDVLVIPVGAQTMAEAIEWGWRVRAATEGVAARSNAAARLVADEGGIGIPMSTNVAALDLVLAGIEASGLRPGDDVAIALDIAASQLLLDGGYHLRVENRTLGAIEWAREIERWTQRYPIVSIEDPFGEDDWDPWTYLTSRIGPRVQIVGDDLFATTSERLRHGIERQAANAVLVKPNQIGTVTATRELMALARREGIRTIVSARSGDTEDYWLTDLAVEWGADQLKVGSLMRSERTAKWNRLLELEADPKVDTALRPWASRD